MKRVLTPVFLLIIVFSLSAIDEDKLDIDRNRRDS